MNNNRGARGGSSQRSRGGYSQGGRGHGGRGGRGSSNSSQRRDNANPPSHKKENILDLSKYSNKRIIVQFQGGRQVSGILKGFDPLQNLVLDDTQEYLRDPDDMTKTGNETRNLGLVVSRGTVITWIGPAEGTEEIDDPFTAVVVAESAETPSAE